jgi:hypothetical protein
MVMVHSILVFSHHATQPPQLSTPIGCCRSVPFSPAHSSTEDSHYSKPGCTLFISVILASMSLEDGIHKEQRKRSGTSCETFHSHLLIFEKGRAMVGLLERQYSRNLTSLLLEIDRTEAQVRGLPHFLMRAFPLAQQA